MKMARVEHRENESVRHGWRIGAEDFHDWLADKLARRGRKGERARERSETDAALAEKIVLGALAKARWREIDLKKATQRTPCESQNSSPPAAANANESTMDSGSLKNGQSQLCFQSLSQCR